MIRRPPPLVVLAVTLIVLAGLAVSAACVTASTRDRQTATRRAEMLRRGVNLSGWFAHGPSDPAHLQGAITSDDVQRIRRMGFDHVRLPVDPATLAPDGAIDAPSPDQLFYLDDAVRLVLDGGLAIVVDLHPDEAFGERLSKDRTAVDRTAALWTTLARRLSDLDADRVYFEVLNEPGAISSTDWASIQSRLVGAIRQAAPHHTIIATGHGWSGVEQLEALRPLDDPNVIYAFHLYDPYAFTHQGAEWSPGPVSSLGRVPYPSSPTAVAPALTGVADAAARKMLIEYADERWDAAAIERLVERAAAWRDRHGIPIICNEFGVYRSVSPAADRFAWLRDVRTALERNKIGWTAWEYAGGFGVVDGPVGQRIIHAQTARALLGE
jgi:endoglucanase